VGKRRQGYRGHRTDTGNSRQPASCLIFLGSLGNLAVQTGDLLVQSPECLDQHPEAWPGKFWDRLDCILNSLHELRNANWPFGRHNAELGQMSSQGVDDLSSLPHQEFAAHQEIAGPEHESGGLRLLALGRHEAHGRALGRLADRLSIHCIVLLPFDERLHVSQRDQPNGMPELADLARPVMRAAAGLHGHRAEPLTCQERENLMPLKLLAEQDRSGCISSVHLEHVLRQVQADCANLTHGRLPQVVLINASTLAHQGRSGRPPHQNLLLSGGFLFHVIAVPAIEVSARYYAASRFYWVAPSGKAALIGLLIRLLEIGTKTFEAALFGPRPSEPVPALVFASISIPIHLALSLAFYAIWSGGWLKLVLLHALINGGGYTTGVHMMGRATVLEYVVMAGSLITGLCMVISLIAVWRMKTRRFPQRDLSSQ
jgi:hypothetical protein